MKKRRKSCLSFDDSETTTSTHTNNTKQLEEKKVNATGSTEEVKHNNKNVVDDIFSMSNRGVELPPDVILHLCHYLHPKSITTMACCNSACWNTIMGGNTTTSSSNTSSISQELWKSLWYRDFGIALLEHDVIRQNIVNISFDVRTRKKKEREMTNTTTTTTSSSTNFSSFFSSKREEETTATTTKQNAISNDNDDDESNTTTTNIYTLIDKAFSSNSFSSCTFYFEFQECYLDYVLVGLNNDTNCYMGLHGHIINFTNFVPYHPGRMEPIMIYCGGDVTDVYEDFHPHSNYARRLVVGLSTILNRSCCYQDKDVYTNTNRRNNNKRRRKSSSNTTKDDDDDDLENRCGLYSSSSSSDTKRTTGSSKTIAAMPMNIYCKNRRPPTMSNIRTNYLRDKHVVDAYVKRYATKLRRQPTNRILQQPTEETTTSLDPPPQDADIRIFYDPFHRQWYGWYNNDDDWKPVIISF